MIIGFDFDKVFIDYPPFVPNSLINLLYMGSSFFRKKTKNSTIHYRFPGILEQKIRVITHLPLFRPLIKENFRVLKKISTDKKYNTHLISSRYSFLEKNTNLLINKYHLKKYFDTINFNYNNEQPHIFKARIIRKLKLDAFIDDDLHLALYLSSKFPKLNIFWITNQRKIDKLPKNIKAISSLSELGKYLKDI